MPFKRLYPFRTSSWLGSFSPRARCLEERPADGHEAVDEIRVERVGACVVALERVCKAVLGHQEVHEQRHHALNAASAVALSVRSLGPASAQASTWCRHTATTSAGRVGKCR